MEFPPSLRFNESSRFENSLDEWPLLEPSSKT